MNYIEFTQQKLGRNWVIARRTPNIVRKYGEDVVCISKQKYAAMEREWRELYGDPYDKPRANLYCALKHAVKLLERRSDVDPQFIDVAKAALYAEAHRP